MKCLIVQQQKDPILVASYDSTVGEVQDALEILINQGQHAWAPYISSWSIKTLGLLSKKYKRSENRGKNSVVCFIPIVSIVLLS